MKPGLSRRLALLRAAGRLALLYCGCMLPAYAADPLPLARQRELVHLVRQDCGSCHGLTLQGGLGSPLTPAALGDKPAASLAATILHGRPGTPMPPFKNMLSAAEADWIVTQLQRGFPLEK